MQRLSAVPPLRVLEGYAPFCRLHLHRNGTSTRCSVIRIGEENRHRLRSAYEARSRDELAVLVRWFEAVEAPVAGLLVPILYSAEQLGWEGSPIEADWGIAGCLYTLQPEEIPMAPITQMRNALGVDQCGLGGALDPAAYRRSVAFWEQSANWR